MKMIRRSFLKMVGAALVAPVAFAKATINKPKAKKRDFVNYLLLQIYALQDKGLVPNHIYVNQKGLDYLKRFSRQKDCYGKTTFYCLKVSVCEYLQNDKPRGFVSCQNPVFHRMIFNWFT